MSEPGMLQPPSCRESQESFEASVAMDQKWSETGHKLAQCNRNEKIIEEKEQQIRSVIQANYARIKDAEKELQEVQLQLKSTVGPKRSVLELLRKKIEAQNSRVVAQRAKVSSAQAVLTREEDALKVEEEAKERLCQELNLVVQESATAEMDRLNQLSSRLTMLTAGVVPEAAADKADAEQQELRRDQDGASSNPFLDNSSAAPSGDAQTAEAEAAADPPNNPFEDPEAASDEPSSPSAVTLEAERKEEERKQQQQQIASAAKAARQKHVMLKKQAKQQPPRPKQGPDSQPPIMSSQQPSASPSEQSQSRPFSGFDT